MDAKKSALLSAYRQEQIEYINAMYEQALAEDLMGAGQVTTSWDLVNTNQVGSHPESSVDLTLPVNVRQDPSIEPRPLNQRLTLGALDKLFDNLADFVSPTHEIHRIAEDYHGRMGLSQEDVRQSSMGRTGFTSRGVVNKPFTRFMDNSVLDVWKVLYRRLVNNNFPNSPIFSLRLMRHLHEVFKAAAAKASYSRNQVGKLVMKVPNNPIRMLPVFGPFRRGKLLVTWKWDELVASIVAEAERANCDSMFGFYRSCFNNPEQEQARKAIKSCDMLINHSLAWIARRNAIAVLFGGIADSFTDSTCHLALNNIKAQEGKKERVGVKHYVRLRIDEAARKMLAKFGVVPVGTENDPARPKAKWTKESVAAQQLLLWGATKQMEEGIDYAGPGYGQLDLADTHLIGVNTPMRADSGKSEAGASAYKNLDNNNTYDPNDYRDWVKARLNAETLTKRFDS